MVSLSPLQQHTHVTHFCTSGDFTTPYDKHTDEARRFLLLFWIAFLRSQRSALCTVDSLLPKKPDHPLFPFTHLNLLYGGVARPVFV